jgi:hypothetical protein
MQPQPRQPGPGRGPIGGVDRPTRAGIPDEVSEGGFMKSLLVALEIGMVAFVVLTVLANARPETKQGQAPGKGGKGDP